MPPRKWRCSSFEAWILRSTFGPQALGKWQSVQMALKPQELVWWVLFMYS
jgi:hypothetical protein